MYVEEVAMRFHELTKGFETLPLTFKVHKRTMKLLWKVAIPKYIRTELKHPRKKPRGTMRRNRKQQKEVADEQTRSN